MINRTGESHPSTTVSHASVYLKGQDKLRNLPEVIISAKAIPGRESFVFVLLECAGKTDWLLFNLQTDAFDRRGVDGILDLLQCGEDEPKAHTSVQEVEAGALAAVQKWHEARLTSVEEQLEYTRILSVYLKASAAREPSAPLTTILGTGSL